MFVLVINTLELGAAREAASSQLSRNLLMEHLPQLVGFVSFDSYQTVH